MIAVFFEVRPKPGRAQRYVDLAAELEPMPIRKILTPRAFAIPIPHRLFHSTNTLPAGRVGKSDAGRGRTGRCGRIELPPRAHRPPDDPHSRYVRTRPRPRAARRGGRPPVRTRCAGAESRRPRPPRAIGFTAGLQTIEWDRRHRFRGACGTPTEQAAGERAKRCPACTLTVYPRIGPAMRVLVTHGDRLPVGRGMNFPPGRCSALAGVLEACESIEECIARGVRDETDVQVRNPLYFGSRSWRFPDSPMIAFMAEYAGGELRHDPADLADARWFGLDALPQMPPRLGIARALLDHTISRMRDA